MSWDMTLIDHTLPAGPERAKVSWGNLHVSFEERVCSRPAITRYSLTRTSWF